VAKTAAASVDPTTAPSRNAAAGDRSKSAQAAAPVTAAVTATPSVLSRKAGASTGRMSFQSVVSPPSNRIASRPITPIERASSASSK
jgi:hypothetical protein